MRPHAEHILLLGNQRLAVTRSVPYCLALYSNWRRNSIGQCGCCGRPLHAGISNVRQDQTTARLVHAFSVIGIEDLIEAAS